MTLMSMMTMKFCTLFLFEKEERRRKRRREVRKTTVISVITVTVVMLGPDQGGTEPPVRVRPVRPSDDSERCSER